MTTSVKKILFVACVISLASSVLAQFNSGDVFREYAWYNEGGDADHALRIGGNDDYFYKTNAENINLSNNFDLTHAVKAELVVEKIQSHEKTYGLKIRLNDSAWIPIPEDVNVPEPQYEYMQHVYPVVSVPLSYLKQGTNNKFRMEIDTTSPGAFGWRQNIVNGLIFRVYYDSSKVDYPNGKILTPSKNDSISESVNITAEASSVNGIKQVDYVGYYEGISYDGDSIYTEWHYNYYHTGIYNHIGTATVLPFTVNWNTEWIPDQQKPIKIMARIIDNTGMIYATEAVDSIFLTKPEGISVELCKPYDIPKNWVTRESVRSEKFDINGDTTKMAMVKLVWTSWSPNYENGLTINNKLYNIDGTFPSYRYYVMEFDIDDPEIFHKKANTIAHVKPTKDLVHGMEIQYPGIMALVKYDDEYVAKPHFNINSGTYPEPQKVHIDSRTIGAEFRYTLDGSTPTASSALYTDSVEIDAPTTIKARSFKDGNESEYFTTISLDFKPDKPNIEIVGEKGNKTLISITSPLSNIEIRYNLNSNDDPDKSSELYTDTLEIEGNTKIKARVYKNGWQDGDTKTYFALVTNINSPGYAQNITVYPNPVSDKLTIETGNALSGEAQITISNILGNVVKTAVIDKTVTHLDVSGLTQGIYVLQVTQGDKNFTQIMIKE